MCARFSVAIPREEIELLFGVQAPPEWEPRWNVAPSQSLLAIGPNRVLSWAEFGIVPVWAKDRKRLVNARFESAPVKPSFRDGFARGRRVLPATSYFEWHGKQPYAFSLPDAPAFGLAAIEQPTGHVVVLTRDAVSEAAEIHDRMPCLLTLARLDRWLDEGDRMDLSEFSTDVQAWPVTSEVNRPTAEGAHLVAPVGLFGSP